ncbi:MAG TPA: YbhB/YbcL family Raf kinase inhibitor-like protein [Terriglobia bacterium]|nr:YbhB/YbcL family Raf kinase inhibitor-like protein [Terriglobia bacterium]
MPGHGSRYRRVVVSGAALAVTACVLMSLSVKTIAAEDSGFHFTSASFQANGDIPPRFTCSGDDLSPALAWIDPPAGTQSFALIADDPDAPGGVFSHWVLYDLPAGTHELPEGVPRTPDPEGGRQGRNDFDKIGYSGPCPPPGSPHRYSFRLYALDKKLNLRGGASKSELERALKGHILAQAELTGHFRR